MCGIAGFWQSARGPEPADDVLRRMGQAIAHRGPDDTGTFHDPATGIGLSFRRLSIVDLSPAGHQPMVSASGRYWIIFNGEVYNWRAIRDEIGAHPWRGHSDTEVMLEAIPRWGLEAAVTRFVGMFAIALWDVEARRLHLIRDRVGIKPVYYGRVRGQFVFGSELKALRAFPGFDNPLNPGALAEYLRHNNVPAPLSVYQGIAKLPPGCILTLTAATAEASIRCVLVRRRRGAGGRRRAP